ncbi:MAG: ATP-binding cassette domain-containing protein [Bacteroidetes bacterium]|nr:MAG: ATP-binding cassette domain-containing protein [Bacteroidota bacterium]TAG92167.1 MAG: ATP-binding cassette domain-containing protein [Bacteroidota bacterium]
MQILLQNIGKRFGREWIFREIHQDFLMGNSYAILGANGSGKSTFLQILIGILPSTEGKIIYQKENKIINNALIFKEICWVAPYLDLIEEFTLEEFLNWHHQLKPFQFSPKTIAEKLGLEKSYHKFLKNFSSGMKQRVKLATALYGNCPILLLDEPTSNLDNYGINWYQNELNSQLKNRLTIICSNQSYEYEMCAYKIELEKFKKK